MASSAIITSRIKKERFPSHMRETENALQPLTQLQEKTYCCQD